MAKMKKAVKKAEKKKINWLLLVLSFAIVFAVAGIGSSFTKIGAWYNSIKPAITPPDFVFPIVWSALFVLIALSMYLALNYAKNNQKPLIIWAFALNLLLNAPWSLVFFTLQSPALAFNVIILLLLSILVMIVFAGRANRLAGWLLVPYFLWVSFATYLTWLIAFAG